MDWYKNWLKDFWESDERFVFITSLMNKYDFAGKTVVDLGAFRGSLSYAALIRGAKHVTLIDENPDAIQYAESKLNDLDPSGERYTCIVNDLFKEELPDRIDAVIACGLIYHTTRQHELMAKIYKSSPQWVILETLRNPPSDFMEVHHWGKPNCHVPNAKLCDIIFRECGYRNWEWTEFIPGRGAYILT